MPALVAGIHVFCGLNEDVDGRVKPGHDASMWFDMSGTCSSSFHGACLGMTVLQWFLRLAAGRFAGMQCPKLNDLLHCALAPCAAKLMRN
jgi:hypothetical protein